MKVVIVIPTYNEAENIGRLLDEVSKEIGKISHETRVLIVDGSSPDGTADVVREKMKSYKFLDIVVKEKGGLGADYIYGFNHAMEKMGADIIVEMDADFQHDPKDLPRLVAEIDNGYDYIIGSRFVKGGSIPKEWEFKRKLFSRLGNIVSKVILGIFNINDFTTGYKVSRVKGFVDQIDFDAVLSKGFAYKINLLFNMCQLGAKVKEVPIQFATRDEGSSKMEGNNLMDSLRVVVTLRLKDKKTQRFLKFCVVGFTGLFVDSGLFNLFRVTVFSSKVSSLVSGFIAMITTFLLNNFWSFKENKLEGAGKKASSFVVYIISSYVPILFRSWLIKFSIDRFGDTFIVSNAAFFIGIVIGLIWNFTVYSRIIWKDK
ncbi:glycosyltransferase [Patescibacteria group bacterium]